MKDYLQLENQHVKRLFEKKNGKIDTLSPLTEKEDLKALKWRRKKVHKAKITYARVPNIRPIRAFRTFCYFKREIQCYFFLLK